MVEQVWGVAGESKFGVVDTAGNGSADRCERVPVQTVQHGAAVRGGSQINAAVTAGTHIIALEFLRGGNIADGLPKLTVGDIRKGCGKGQRAVRLYLDIVQGNAAVCAVAVDQRTVLERFGQVGCADGIRCICAAVAGTGEVTLSGIQCRFAGTEYVNAVGVATVVPLDSRVDAVDDHAIAVDFGVQLIGILLAGLAVFHSEKFRVGERRFQQVQPVSAV